MLFIVNGEVEISQYMDDDPPIVKQVMHPVEADDIDTAKSIFLDHYNSKTDEYAVYYSVKVISVFETLRKK